MTVQWIELHAYTRRARIQSLFRKLCLHNLHSGHPRKKKLSVGGDPVCNVYQDWATTTALLWECIAPQNFLANRWPKKYLVSALQRLFDSLGVLVVGFTSISTLCLLSTFS